MPPDGLQPLCFQAPSGVLNFLMSFVLGILSLLAQHVLVLDGVDGGNPELHLGQYAQALWLGHLSVVILEPVEGVAT